MQSAVLWLHNVYLDSTLHGGFKPLLSLCGFKPLGFREASFILTLIYPDPRLAEETPRAADWFHADVQAPKGRGKGFTYGQHEADKRKREGNTYTRVTELMRLKTIKHQNMRNDQPRGVGCPRGTRIRIPASSGRTSTAVGGVAHVATRRQEGGSANT